jgi:hypothetical protein
MEVLYVPHCLVDPREAGTHSVGENPALGGEADPSVVPLEEGTPEPPLQLPNRMTNRRLSDLQLVGRTGKAVMASHDRKGIEALDRRQVAKVCAGLGSDLIHDAMRLLFIYIE